MYNFFTIVLFIGLLLGCGANSENSGKELANSTSSPASNPAAPAPAQTPAKQYPSISVEEMQNLWNNTSAIDYLFYELPISMNMVEKPAIQNILRQIANQPAQTSNNCKAMGRVFFQDNGESLAEADFYFTPECTYFIFFEDQKPVKSNQMTQEGIAFFENLLNNATKGQQ